MNPTLPVETALHSYNLAKAELETEAKKALPVFLEAEDLSDYGKTRSGNYELKASQYWLDSVSADNEFTFESEDDYQYIPFEFLKDPEAHLERARKEAVQREEERKNRTLRLRNERIREAKATLEREGIDISGLVTDGVL